MARLSTLLLLALLVVWLPVAARAGHEVSNEEGDYDKTYKGVVVKEASGEKPEIAQGARAVVDGEKVWVYLPDSEKPWKTRAVIFYDWGYQLEITVYHEEAGKRYILVCPHKRKHPLGH